MSDLEPYDGGGAEGDGDGSMSGGVLTKWIAGRLGRKLDQGTTDNRRTIWNFFSPTTTNIYNDNRRSVFGGGERRARRWE